MDLAAGVAAVLFDFDGTLYDLVVDLEPWRARIAAATGSADHRVDSLLAALAPPARSAAMAELADLELAGLDSGSSAAGAEQVVQALGSRYRVGVVSRNSAACIGAGWQRLGGRGDAVLVGREDAHRMKPDPESVLIALHRLGVAPGEAILVGDSSHDVLAARAAGVRSVIVPNVKLEFPPPAADYYLDVLSQLPAALGVGPMTEDGR